MVNSKSYENRPTQCKSERASERTLILMDKSDQTWFETVCRGISLRNVEDMSPFLVWRRFSHLRMFTT